MNPTHPTPDPGEALDGNEHQVWLGYQCDLHLWPEHRRDLQPAQLINRVVPCAGARELAFSRLFLRLFLTFPRNLTGVGPGRARLQHRFFQAKRRGALYAFFFRGKPHAILPYVKNGLAPSAWPAPWIDVSLCHVTR